MNHEHDRKYRSHIAIYDPSQFIVSFSPSLPLSLIGRVCITSFLAFLLLSIIGCQFTGTRHQSVNQADLSFGSQWVRSHPFQITALTQRTAAVDDNKYTEAGFNSMLAWKRWSDLIGGANRQGIPWHAHFNKRYNFEEATGHIAQVIDNHIGGEAVMVWDEPKRPQFAEAGRIIAWAKETYPDLLVYSNAYPPAPNGKLWGGKWLGPDLYEQAPGGYTYHQYLSEFVNVIQPHVLQLDIYPFKIPPEGIEEQYVHKLYYSALTDCRNVAQTAGIPYWLCIQAFAHEGGGARRYPTESDLRFQVYVALTYGFTAIHYFTFDHVFKGALLKDPFHEIEGRSEPGEPTYLYYDAKYVNREIKHLGRTLRFLQSTGVHYVPGGQWIDGKLKINPVPIGLDAYTRDTSPQLIKNITIHEQGNDHNGLIGFFKDNAGDDYMMLVNLTHGEGLNATQAEQTMTIQFPSTVKSITRLSRETGSVEQLVVDYNQLKITLPGGTGDLFKLTGKPIFAGIE